MCTDTDAKGFLQAPLKALHIPDSSQRVKDHIAHWVEMLSGKKSSSDASIHRPAQVLSTGYTAIKRLVSWGKQTVSGKDHLAGRRVFIASCFCSSTPCVVSKVAKPDHFRGQVYKNEDISSKRHAWLCSVPLHKGTLLLEKLWLCCEHIKCVMDTWHLPQWKSKYPTSWKHPIRMA